MDQSAIFFGNATLHFREGAPYFSKPHHLFVCIRCSGCLDLSKGFQALFFLRTNYSTGVKIFLMPLEFPDEHKEGPSSEAKIDSFTVF